MRLKICLFFAIFLIASSAFVEAFTWNYELPDGSAAYRIERKHAEQLNYEFSVYEKRKDSAEKRVGTFRAAVIDVNREEPRKSIVSDGKTLWLTTEFGVCGDSLLAFDLTGTSKVRMIKYPNAGLFQGWGIRLSLVDGRLAVRLHKNGTLYGYMSREESFYHEFVLLGNGEWEEISDGIKERWQAPRDGLERDAYVLDNIKKRNAARKARDPNAVPYALPKAASSKRKRGGRVPENETATAEEKIP